MAKKNLPLYPIKAMECKTSGGGSEENYYIYKMALAELNEVKFINALCITTNKLEDLTTADIVQEVFGKSMLFSACTIDNKLLIIQSTSDASSRKGFESFLYDGTSYLSMDNSSIISAIQDGTISFTRY